MRACVRACVRPCVRACVRVCVCVFIYFTCSKATLRKLQRDGVERINYEAFPSA